MSMMHRWVELVAIAALSSVAIGQPRSVTGTVLKPDGKPVANALVWLVVGRWDEEQSSVKVRMTDRAGRFRFANLPMDERAFAYVLAHHPKFAVTWEKVDWKKIKPLTLRLSYPASLLGIVVSHEGKPIAEAKVGVQSLSPSVHRAFQPRRPLPLPIPSEVKPLWTETDERGRFTLHHLPPDTLLSLSVTHPNFAPTSFPYPEVPELMPTVRTESVTVRTDLVIALVPYSFLEGQVVRDGKPVFNAEVACALQGHIRQPLRKRTDAKGRFRFALPPGIWDVKAFADKGRWQSEQQRFQLFPSSTISVTLPLQRATLVKGRVINTKTKKPIADAIVRVTRGSTLSVISTHTDKAHTDSKGTFQLWLLPGNWQLSAVKWERKGGYKHQAVSVMVKGNEMTLPDLLLEPQELREPKEVTFFVVDEKGKPVRRALISSFDESQQADEQGRCTFPFQQLPKKVWAASPDLTAFGCVEIKPDVKTVRIVLQKGISVQGQVTDEKDKPIANATVRILAVPVGSQRVAAILPGGVVLPSSQEWLEWFAITTDKQGRFSLSLPPDQPFQLMASAKGYWEAWSKVFTLQNDKPATLPPIKLPYADGALEGIVVDEETGKPITGAIVKVRPLGASKLRSLFACTDLQGHFRIAGLKPDTYSDITVSNPLYEMLCRPMVKVPAKRVQFALTPKHPLVTAKVAENKPAPPLKDVQWLTGEPNLKGKVTILLFTAAYKHKCEWVHECLKALQKRFGDKIQVVAVFDASVSIIGLAKFVRDTNLPFLIGIVPEGKRKGWDSKAFRLYGVKSLPKLIVIDRKGIVCAINPPLERLEGLVTSKK